MFLKLTKKVIALTLIFSLALASAVVTPATKSINAAKKLTINKKSLSIKVGQKVNPKLTSNKKAIWSISDSSKASLSTKNNKASKSTKVTALSPGKATITAKVGSATAKCKVTVGKPASGTVIFNLAKETRKDPETGKSCAPPQVSNYDEFRYSSYKIWKSQFSFYDPAHNGKNFKGVKLKFTIKYKNTGKRDLPELAFCFNYTKGTDEGPYPFILHIKKNIESSVKKLKNHKRCKYINETIKKGKMYTKTFYYTIPAGAQNGDLDDDKNPYPIEFFIPNLKDSGPYIKGDELTIYGLVIKVA